MAPSAAWSGAECGTAVARLRRASSRYAQRPCPPRPDLQNAMTLFERHLALAHAWSMIFPETGIQPGSSPGQAFFGIMLYARHRHEHGTGDSGGERGRRFSGTDRLYQ